jgi:hypothetical protein
MAASNPVMPPGAVAARLEYDDDRGTTREYVWFLGWGHPTEAGPLAIVADPVTGIVSTVRLQTVQLQFLPIGRLS